ncbi:MAG: 6,7-dimethyl-8-ribityllumazine synthase [Burkholderiales bacterium]|nr:6,7-dimethyl-8-ribityllumazine synthase [Burkholderiales bacterium]
MNQIPSNPTLRIAVIHAAWHDDLVAATRAAIRDELTRHGATEHITFEISEYDVPGAFEIPLRAKQLATLARDARPDAIIACGFVVDGGIYRHEFVAAAVIDGLMRVQLDTGVPVFSAVLTPQQFHEHAAHQQFFREHMKHKGREVAKACLHTLDGMRRMAEAA